MIMNQGQEQFFSYIPTILCQAPPEKVVMTMTAHYYFDFLL